MPCKLLVSGTSLNFFELQNEKNGDIYKGQIDTDFIFTLGFNKAQADYFPSIKFILFIYYHI